jgi:hypothetical protein
MEQPISLLSVSIRLPSFLPSSLPLLIICKTIVLTFHNYTNMPRILLRSAAQLSAEHKNKLHRPKLDSILTA